MCDVRDIYYVYIDMYSVYLIDMYYVYMCGMCDVRMVCDMIHWHVYSVWHLYVACDICILYTCVLCVTSVWCVTWLIDMCITCDMCMWSASWFIYMTDWYVLCIRVRNVWRPYDVCHESLMCVLRVTFVCGVWHDWGVVLVLYDIGHILYRTYVTTHNNTTAWPRLVGFLRL